MKKVGSDTCRLFVINQILAYFAGVLLSCVANLYMVHQCEFAAPPFLILMPASTSISIYCAIRIYFFGLTYGVSRLIFLHLD